MIHSNYKDSRCSKCSAFYIPFKKDFRCPNCNELINEFYDLVSETISLMKGNKKKYGTYKPTDWSTNTFSDFVQKHIYEVLDSAEKNNFTDKEDYIKFSFRRDNWVAEEYQRKHIEEIAISVTRYLQEEQEEEQIRKIQSAKTGEPIDGLIGYGIIDANGNDNGKRFIRIEYAKEYERRQHQG
jgi:phage FluMu protein Com